MNLYTLGPKPVIDNLSQQAKAILLKRLHNNKLMPYYPVQHNLRIRGLKPSLLYIHYTNLRADNTLESIYLADAEEEQCALVKAVLDTASDLNQRAEMEDLWTKWEDAFMSNVDVKPLNDSLDYTDLMNNTFVHCIAYVCVHKEPTDLDNIEKHFQIIINSPNIYKKNTLGETPLQILLTNPNLSPYVESLLLRLYPSNRLKALDFSNWHNSWGTLLNNVFDLNMCQLIYQTVNLPGFLTIFMYLSHNSETALMKLFQAAYKLQCNHLILDKLSPNQKHIISACLLSVPNWSNLTLWMYLITSNSTEKSYKKIQKYIVARNNLIKLAFIAQPFKYYLHIDY